MAGAVKNADVAAKQKSKAKATMEAGATSAQLAFRSHQSSGTQDGFIAANDKHQFKLLVNLDDEKGRKNAKKPTRAPQEANRCQQRWRAAA
jgi:hypothetical protein